MAANEEEVFPVRISDPKHPLNHRKTVLRNVQNPHGGPPIVQSETAPVCNYCHKDEDELGLKLKICSRCHKARYCSRKHQKKDWKSHKAVCQVSLLDYMDPPFEFSFTDEDFVLKKMASEEEFDLLTNLSKKAGKYRKARLRAVKLDDRFHTTMNTFITSDEFLPLGTVRFLAGFFVTQISPGNAMIGSGMHFIPT